MTADRWEWDEGLRSWVRVSDDGSREPGSPPQFVLAAKGGDKGR